MSVTPANRQLQSVVSGHVAGTNWGQAFITEDILPGVNVGAEKFGYEVWGNEGLEDVGSTAKRAINGDTKTVDPPKNSYVEDTLDEWALNTRLDKRVIHNAEVNERLRGVTGPGSDGLSAVDRLRVRRANRLKYNIAIQKEKAAATILFGTGNYVSGLWYGTGGGSSAVDFTATGILSKIMIAKDAVAQRYGFEPDTLILGRQKFIDLWNNSDVVARITGGSTTANPAIVNFDLLAALFGVKRLVVGRAVSQTQVDPGDTGASTTSTSLWTSTTAALIYSGEFDMADESSPAFAKQFYMDAPTTNTRNEVATWDSENGKLEYLEYTEFFKLVQVCKAGAIFTT